MQAALAEVKSTPCRLNAQSHLTGLYAERGFTPDGISHTPMLRVGPLAAFLPHTIDTAS
jgi:ElaA protein